MSANPFCLLGISEKSRAVALMWSSGGFLVFVFKRSTKGLCLKLWNYSATKWSEESELVKTKDHQAKFRPAQSLMIIRTIISI